LFSVFFKLRDIRVVHTLSAHYCSMCRVILQRNFENKTVHNPYADRCLIIEASGGDKAFPKILSIEMPRIPF